MKQFDKAKQWSRVTKTVQRIGENTKIVKICFLHFFDERRFLFLRLTSVFKVVHQIKTDTTRENEKE